MKKFATSLLALSLTSAFSLSLAHASTYQVIDKGAASSLEYTYGKQENNSGQMVIAGTTIYNFPVQFQYLTETNIDNIITYANVNHELVFDLSDIENEASLRAGQPTANDLAWTVLYLQNNASSTLFQKVGNVVAMINDGTETKEIVVFDEFVTGTQTYSRSTTDYVNGITEQGWVYGNASAPFLPIPFTEEDGDEVTHWVRDFSNRGYYSPDSGQTIIPLIPPESTYGGESAIFDISDNGIAVGYASTSVAEEALEFIADEDGGCADPERLLVSPIEVCIQQVSENMYNAEAFKWVLDQNGIVSSEALGQLVTPHADDVREYISYAQAVNIHGVAVGYAHGWWDENETAPSATEARSIYAVVFKNGEVIDFTDDHSKYFNSRTNDINNNGMAVGHVETYINGSLRQKFYYVDTTVEQMEMVLPTDFFTGSSSTAYSINENNLVVGSGEVETHNDTSNNPRRRHGYLYDITNDIFSDLNDFLPCDSEYTIIEARSINENNEISATAVVKAPLRDAKGELYYNENGEQVFEDVLRAVKLAPIAGGQVEDCTVTEEKVERQGASTGLYGLFALFIAGISRRLFIRKDS
ncbi:DUF3466 family protein [Thalassotalea profundi]|uniref:DUF3466 family protein n=1 Tax=Thalassotalea profundi TaxID=2036687 RepID=A0ABQ3II38_9GAMM|nr:DUF3466 family protein [Thalassotalea profundi]GHE82262.1 hypothetical protein GCM10011501_08030 [Thalassotalea profundi]